MLAMGAISPEVLLLKFTFWVLLERKR